MEPPTNHYSFNHAIRAIQGDILVKNNKNNLLQVDLYFILPKAVLQCFDLIIEDAHLRELGYLTEPFVF